MAERLFGTNGAVGPDFDDELIVIGVLADARALHVEIDTANRAENRVDRQFADRQAATFFGRAVATTGMDFEFHFQVRVRRIDREQVKIGVHDFDFGRADDIGRGDGALATVFETQTGRLHTIEHQPELLDLENKLGHVLAYAGDGREFMMDIRHTYAGDGGPGNRRQQNAPQRIAQCQTISIFQRADNKAPIIARYRIPLYLVWQNHVASDQN